MQWHHLPVRRTSLAARSHPTIPNMTFPRTLICLAALAAAPTFSPAVADEHAEATTLQQLEADALKSLVVVEMTYDYEMGRQELRALGLVIDDAGTVMVQIDFVSPSFPDDYLTDFKIKLPADDGVRETSEEFDAELVGRDERYGLAYVRPAEGVEHDWTPITFEAGEVKPGDTLTSVGRLGEAAAYQGYVTTPEVMTTLRGEVPQVLVSPEGVAMVGSPVFDGQGRAIGVVHQQGETLSFLDVRGTAMTVAMGEALRLFRPAADFLPALADVPAAGEPVKIPWLGVASLEGVEEELAEFYDIKGVTAVTVGDVVEGFAAEEAGLTDGDIIVKVNGEPLEKVDAPEEAPDILTRDLRRMKVGGEVTLTVLRATTDEQREAAGDDAPASGMAETDLTLTLEERPAQQGTQPREYFEDLGYTVRDVVFSDTYSRKMSADTPGVVVSFIRPNSAAATAQPEGLQNNDLIQKLNTDNVEDVEQFTEIYNAFREASPTEAVVLEVLRGIETKIIRIEPPQE